MENIIFIIFIIIFSIISSVLKSKKGTPAPPQKEQNKPGGNRAQQNRYENQRPQQKSGGEILEEVQKILRGEIPEPEYTYNRAPEPEPVVAEEVKKVEAFTNTELAKLPIVTGQKEYTVDQKEYTTDSNFQYKDTRALDYRKKMQNVSNFREYILISEILGKPRAYKRR